MAGLFLRATGDALQAEGEHIKHGIGLRVSACLASTTRLTDARSAASTDCLVTFSDPAPAPDHGLIDLYHGTRADLVPAILTEGLRWKDEPGPFVTDSRRLAWMYAVRNVAWAMERHGGPNLGAVLHLRVDAGFLIDDPTGPNGEPHEREFFVTRDVVPEAIYAVETNHRVDALDEEPQWRAQQAARVDRARLLQRHAADLQGWSRTLGGRTPA